MKQPPPLHYVNAPQRRRSRIPIIIASMALIAIPAAFALTASILGSTPPPATSSRPTATINFKHGTEAIITSSTTFAMLYDPRTDFCDSSAPDTLSPTCVIPLTDPKLISFCQVNDSTDSYFGGQSSALSVAWALYECSQAQQALNENRYSDCSNALIRATRAAMPDNTRKGPPNFGYLYMACRNSARYNAPEFQLPVDDPK